MDARDAEKRRVSRANHAHDVQTRVRQNGHETTCPRKGDRIHRPLLAILYARRAKVHQEIGAYIRIANADRM